jgi:short/branched chain acyl-CoA dehydrogenase
MLDFELTEEQRMIQETARRFAREEVAPRCDEWNDKDYFPYDLNARLAELGLSGIMVPEEYGGTNQGVLTEELVTEELARVDDGFAQTFHMQGLMADMIVKFGNEEQKRRLLPTIVKGENPAFALTEPNAGSDASGLETRAELKNGEWVINGNKMFITNAGLETCTWMVVMCVTGKREDGGKEISSIIVPKNSPGLKIGRNIRKIGWHNLDNRELTFEDCRVPEENLLGKRGRGIAQALYTLDLGRIDFGALAVGMAQGSYELALEHAKQRVQFGKPIGKFQAIQFKLADMRTEIELGRLMYYKAAWLRDKGMPHTLEAAMTKLYTSEMAVRVINEAMQIFGGYGFTLEYPISRFYRNIRIYTVGEGTSEIQRIVIARALGL